MKITLKNIQEFSENMEYTFAEPFLKIIKKKITDYSGTTKERLKTFLENIQNGGCQSGWIKEFIYNEDCKKFYIKHIDDLEEYYTETIESWGGDPIKTDLPRYTHVVWLAFGEFCYDIYNNILENEEEEEEEAEE